MKMCSLLDNRPNCLRVTALVIGVSFAALFSALAEPVLRVDFDASNSTPEMTQEGFVSFAALRDEESPMRPLSSTYTGNINVTVAGRTDREGDMIAMEGEPSRIWGRRREIERSSAEFPYHRLYSDWIAGKQLVLQITGLKPGAKYLLTFFACDYKTSGTIFIEDVLDSRTRSAQIEWIAKEPFSQATPITIHSAVIEVVSSRKGHVLFRIEGTVGSEASALLNGFHLEAVK